MSIYDNLEKLALKSMPRDEFSDAGIPYKARKAKYKKFIQARSKKKKPSDREYAGSYATVGGIAGGLMGTVIGGANIGTAGGAALGGVAGGLVGAGVGYLSGLGQATAEQKAIDNARRVVKSGKYDKALQDEVIAYRRRKRDEAEMNRRLDNYERRMQHSELRGEIRQLRREQHRSTYGSSSPKSGTVILRY